MSTRITLPILTICAALAAVLAFTGDTRVVADEPAGSLLEKLAAETSRVVDRADSASVWVRTKQAHLRGVIVGTPPRIVTPHIGKVRTGKIEGTFSDGGKSDLKLLDGDPELGISVFEIADPGSRRGLALAETSAVRRGALGVLSGETPRMALVSRVDGARGRFRASVDSDAPALIAPRGELLGVRSMLAAGGQQFCSACHTTSVGHTALALSALRNATLKPLRVEYTVIDKDGNPVLTRRDSAGRLVGANGNPHAWYPYVASGYVNSNPLVVNSAGTSWHTHHANPMAHANDYISAAVIRRVLADIDAHGKIRHAYLGVVPGNADAKRQGVRLSSVLADSPAAKAGLTAGDIVTAADGHKTLSPAAFTALLAQKRPGERLTIARHGKDEVTVTMGDRAEVQSRLLTPNHLGFGIGPLEDTLRVWLEIPEAVNGVLVTSVANGPAMAGGLRRGDVIIELAGKPVRDVGELEAVLAGTTGPMALTVQRASKRTTLHVNPPANRGGRKAR